jgi:hypothetical protein
MINKFKNMVSLIVSVLETKSKGRSMSNDSLKRQLLKIYFFQNRFLKCAFAVFLFFCEYKNREVLLEDRTKKTLDLLL